MATQQTKTSEISKAMIDFVRATQAYAYMSQHYLKRTVEDREAKNEIDAYWLDLESMADKLITSLIEE